MKGTSRDHPYIISLIDSGARHWVPTPTPIIAHAHGFWVGMGAKNSWVGMGSILLFMGEHGQTKHIERVIE